MARTKEYPVRHPKKDLLVTVFQKHCDNAIPGDDLNCAIVLAALDGREFEHFEVHISLAYGRYKGGKVNFRWINTAGVNRFLESIDVLEGKVTVPPEGLRLKFRVPSKSLVDLRSDEHRKKRRESYDRRRGKKRRDYTVSDAKTAAGVRSRFGRHPEKLGYES
jgi:hypothetical protein